MNAPAAEPRRTTVPVAEAPRWERIFVDIFTKHPFAKGFSVLLGIILVMLIDRELIEPIFDEQVGLTTSATGSRYEMIIVLPGDYIVEEIEKPRVRVRITGRSKERERIRPPFEAHIPAERLVAIDQDPKRTGSISLGKGDLRLPELHNPEVSMDPVTLRISKSVTRDLPLVQQKLPKDVGYDLVVSFEPPSLSVKGPASELLSPGRTAIEIPVAVPDAVGIAQMQTPPFPEALLTQRIRPVDRSVQIVATVKRVPRDEDTIELTNLRIEVSRMDGIPYEFSFDRPYDTGLPKLVLAGPKLEVEKYRQDPKELEELYVTVLGQRAAETNQAKIDAATDPGGVTVIANAYVPPHLLTRYKLRVKDSEDNLIKVPIKVRKKV